MLNYVRISIYIYICRQTANTRDDFIFKNMLKRKDAFILPEKTHFTKQSHESVYQRL